MTETIYMSKICHFYGSKQSLQDFDMCVHKGEVLCLLGPSGCGKTTVLRIISGFEQPKSGDVFIHKSHVSGHGKNTLPEKRDVGFVFQDYALFPHISVKDNVAFGIRHLNRKIRQNKILDVLSRVGMSEYLDHFPHMLSGGQQQRVALARALAPEPKVILLDEPFSGLDVRLRSHVRDEILHILKSSGASVVMVTHDPEEAMFMGDRILLMRDGQVVQTGKPDELYLSPNSGFVAEFFGDINKVKGVVKNGLIRSPFGEIQNNKFQEGQKVEIFIRPEAIHLQPIDKDQKPNARIVFEKRLGSNMYLHLNLQEEKGKEWHLHAIIPAYGKHKKSLRYQLKCEPDQMYIFPENE